MRTIIMVLGVILWSSTILSQEPSEQLMKLKKLVGEWQSISVNLKTGEESSGKSTIQWILGENWLEWKFESQMPQSHVEVLTLINYNNEKEQYAFYSYNSINEQMLPHYGTWQSNGMLRLKITEDGQHIYVDIRIKSSSEFEQIHSIVSPSGEIIPTRKTRYTKNN